MKNYLYVDGSNLYAGQYELFGPKKYLDFAKFIKDVEKNLKINFDKIYFYASYSPKPLKLSKKQEKFLKNEGLFYQSARKVNNLKFFKGHRSLSSGKEKGVDVALASDLVRFACKKKFKCGYIITGDADFQHCLEIAVEEKRKIKLIAFENRFPYRLSNIYKTYLFWFKKIPKIYNKSKVRVIKTEISCIKEI